MKNPFPTKINGWSLKSLRSCDGMEGLAWSATIFYQGEKVGSVNDDGAGGPLFIRFTEDKQHLEKTLANDGEALFGENEYSRGSVLSRLADNMDAMKTVQYTSKKNIVVLFADDIESASITKFATPNNSAYTQELDKKFDDLAAKQYPGKEYFNFSAYLAGFIDDNGEKCDGDKLLVEFLSVSRRRDR